MESATFIILLSAFSVISGLVTEGVKKLLSDFSSNIIALVIALIIGGLGTVIFYQLNAIPFTFNNIIIAVLMGLASGLVSMVGFDKVKQAIEQITGNK